MKKTKKERREYKKRKAERKLASMTEEERKKHKELCQMMRRNQIRNQIKKLCSAKI